MSNEIKYGEMEDKEGGGIPPNDENYGLSCLMQLKEECCDEFPDKEDLGSEENDENTEEKEEVRKSSDEENEELLTCNTCKVKYENKNLLQKHFMFDHINILYRCKLCSKDFESPVILSIHLVQHGEDPIPEEILESSDLYLPDNKVKNYKGLYICKLCPKRKVTKSRQKHIKSTYNLLKEHMIFAHTKAASRCRKCNDLFDSRFHAHYHYDSFCKTKDIRCYVCGIKFTKHQLQQRKKHMAFFHRIFKSMYTDPEEKTTLEEKAQNDQSSTSFEDGCEYALVEKFKYFCKICGKEAQGKSSLIPHLRKDHDFENDKNIKPINHNIGNYSLGKFKSKIFRCKICQIPFLKKWGLQSHLITRHTEHRLAEKIECQLCHKKLSKSSLKSHNCQTSNSAIQYNCNLCTYTSVRISNLKCHMRNHTDRKTFAKTHDCSDCTEMFKSPEDSQVHYLIAHKNRYPLTCLICGREDFPNKLNALHHVKSIHKMTFAKAIAKDFTGSEHLSKEARMKNRFEDKFNSLNTQIFKE